MVRITASHLWARVGVGVRVMGYRARVGGLGFRAGSGLWLQL